MEALVDTGATTTVVWPGPVLRRLGISPSRRETFEYAGGERVELDMAEARARVDGRETTTWVIFGEEGTSALLGAYTLEGVFLGVDPYGGRLIPDRRALEGRRGRNCSESLRGSASAPFVPVERDLCTTVLPTKAGIHPLPTVDSRLRGKDGWGCSSRSLNSYPRDCERAV